MLINIHKRRLVATPVAVVRCRKDCGDVLVVCGSVALPYSSKYVHHQLVRSCNHLEVVVVVELLRDVLAEGVTRPTWVDAPAATVVWVRPQ